MINKRMGWMLQLVLVVGVTLLFTACQRTSEESSAPAPVAAPAAPVAEVTQQSCSLTEAEILIEQVELRGEDCTVLLPLDAAPGTLDIRTVAVSGREAIVTWTREDQRLQADQGTVTLEHFATEGRVAGELDARATGGSPASALRATFDVQLAP